VGLWVSHRVRSVRLDADLKQAIDVFQIDSGLTTEKVSFLIDVNQDDKLDSIKLLTKGFFVMSGADQVKYSLSLSLKYDWSASAYAIPTTTKEISLF